jgi:glutamyl-tRNA synthetase
VRLRPIFQAAGVWDEAYLGEKAEWFARVLELLRPRARKLEEFLAVGRFFFTDALEYDDVAVAKHLRQDGMAGHLAAGDAALGGLTMFEPAAIEATLRALAESRALKPPTLMHAVRVAVTGKAASPGLFEVLALLGRERTRARLAAAIHLAS